MRLNIDSAGDELRHIGNVFDEFKSHFEGCHEFLELKGVQFTFAIVGAMLLIGGGSGLTFGLFGGFFGYMNYYEILLAVKVAVVLLIAGGVLTGLSHGGWSD